MRILVIGGTRFIGRHVVLEALQAGHEVTVFHRGSAGPGLFPEATHIIGDRDADLSPLAEGRWEATIDMCAYFPRQVNALADVLGARGGHYTLVSSVSAYHPDVPAGYAEDARLATLDDPDADEVTDLTYGGLKVLCEQAAAERFSDPLIVRPTYVVGPHDVSWRFPWWVTRLAAGGAVLAPGPADAPAQVIDVRDLAAWMMSMVAAGRGGAFHTVGPAAAITWGTLLERVAAVVAPAGTDFTWVDASFLLQQGLDDTALPLWPGPDPAINMLTADPRAAMAAGLVLRPLTSTIDDTLAWAQSLGTKLPAAAADRLSPASEADLLERWLRR